MTSSAVKNQIGAALAPALSNLLALAAGNIELAFRIFDLAASHSVKRNEYRELLRQKRAELERHRRPIS